MNIVFSRDPVAELQKGAEGYASVHVVTDQNVSRLVLPRLGLPESWPVTTIPAGEGHKDIETTAQVWRGLARQGATRRSLVVNVGGGVVSDLGGFAAATFKRGIHTVNVPTTLLAMVDASVGGKTGIDFDGLKNEIGAFHEPEAVIIDPALLSTLPQTELLSGYGEMLKHAFLDGAAAVRDTMATVGTNPAPQALLERNIETKRRIVEQDPTEKGLRQVLNLGHTVGHALESLQNGKSSNPTFPHGVAVAYGLLAELVLSHTQLGFPSAELYPYAEMLKDHFAPLCPLRLTCDDYPRLFQYMRHDKKNVRPGQIAFTLLNAPGEPVYGQTPDDEAIQAALDITRDLLAM